MHQHGKKARMLDELLNSGGADEVVFAYGIKMVRQPNGSLKRKETLLGGKKLRKKARIAARIAARASS